jgi:predicted DsbA family dithiol-disulfide isomerase
MLFRQRLLPYSQLVLSEDPCRKRADVQPMRVEIWSDVVCPWCYIGKRRFESALSRFAHREQVEVVWRSFELDPHAPRRSEGALEEMLSRKYGVSLAEASAMNARVTGLAAKEGLAYHLDQAQHGNTFDAHRLIHLGAAHHLQGEVKERLLRAYFSEGRSISDPATLVALGAEAGIPPAEVRAMLAGDTYAGAVRADERRAAAFGIRGVPFFVIDERFGVSGAQDAAVLLNALEKAWAQAHPPALAGAAQERVETRAGGAWTPAKTKQVIGLE